jgi:hypothetical protein
VSITAYQNRLRAAAVEKRYCRTLRSLHLFLDGDSVAAYFDIQLQANMCRGDNIIVRTRLKRSLRLELLLTGMLVALSGGCGLCGNDEVVRVASPDAILEAVIFQRNCGATTDFSTQISIVARGASLPDSGGNTYVADRDHGKAPKASWGGPQADVEWSGPRKVKIFTHPDARVFHKESAVYISTGLFSKEKVTVQYVLKGL